MLKTECSFCIITGCDGNIDLVFAIDSSNSVLESNYQSQPLEGWTQHKNFLKSVVQNLPVGSSTLVSAVRYSTQADIMFHFDQFENSINIQDALWNMDPRGGNTNTASALRTIDVSIMTSSRGERSNARDVLVILTDGLSNIDETRTAQYAQNLKNSGIEIFAVSTSNEIDIKEVI